MDAGPRFERHVYIGVTPEKVWDALTDPKIVETYHFVPLMTVDLKEGGPIVYGAGGKVFIEGSITALDPCKKLSHTFSFTPDTHKNVAGDAPSLLTYEITPVGTKMSELTLTHSGFRSENQTYANILGGWDAILCSLKTLLETGKPLPWPRK